MNEEANRIADAAVGAGRIAEAIAVLTEGLNHHPGDFAGWMKLAALRRHTGDLHGSLAALNGALDASPNAFLALLMKGSLLERLGEAARAAEIYQAAVFHADQQDEALPPPVATQLARARAFVAERRDAIATTLTALPSLDAAHRARAGRLVENVLARREHWPQQPTHYRYPGLPDVEFFDFAFAALRDRLRAAFPRIRAEFEGLVAAHGERQRPYVDFAAGQPVGQWAELNRSTSWNALHLLRYGERDPINAPLCPETLAAFTGEEQADIPGLSPNLMFSLLAPHTHIPPHHGVANFRLVCHLPLIVPAGCRFRVGGETRLWVEGEPWVFDDTIEHEAWNDSDHLRVVLIGDLWRPELDQADRTIVREFLRLADGPAKLGAL